MLAVFLLQLKFVAREQPQTAAKAIVDNVALDAVRTAAVAALPPAVEAAPELVPYGPDASKALEITFREALRLGHNYIGTEHILLALLEIEDDHGILSSLGLERSEIETFIVSAL